MPTPRERPSQRASAQAMHGSERPSAAPCASGTAPAGETGATKRVLLRIISGLSPETFRNLPWSRGEGRKRKDTGSNPPDADTVAAIAALLQSIGEPRRATPCPQAFGDAGDSKRLPARGKSTPHAKEAPFKHFEERNSRNLPSLVESAREISLSLSELHRGGEVWGVAVTKRLRASVSLKAPSLPPPWTPPPYREAG